EPSVWPLGFERLPPPSVTANVTVTPAIGLLPASTTSSASADGRVARTTPVCPSPPALMSWAAACATDTVTWALNPPVVAIACALPLPTAVTRPDADTRSEERRVGKEWGRGVGRVDGDKGEMVDEET